MACHHFGEPLHLPMVAYCPLDPSEQNFMKSNTYFIIFQKTHLNMLSANCQPFFKASNVKSQGACIRCLQGCQCYLSYFSHYKFSSCINSLVQVQVMTWYCLAISHFLSQCWPRSMSPRVTRPQWVNNVMVQQWLDLETIITTIICIESGLASHLDQVFLTDN